jgi:DNA-binding Xre family transcriptional regulator
MLVLNLKRVFAIRAVEKPSGFMVKRGISRQTTYNLLNQESSLVRIEHIGILCRELNCTPNDLFEWEGGANSLPETHSLNALRRTQNARGIKEMMRELPLEKVESLIKEE